MPLQNEEQQSMLCLIQQIGLYKELLAQVNYQNQLLTRDITMKQQQQQQQNNMGQFGGNMNFMGMGTTNTGINMNPLNNANNIGNSGFGGLGNMGLAGLGNNINSMDVMSMQNMIGSTTS